MFLTILLGAFINVFLVGAYFENHQHERILAIDVFRSINAIISYDSVLKLKDLHLSVLLDQKNKESMNCINDITTLLLMNSHDRCVIVDYENTLEFKSKLHFQVILLDTFSSLEKLYKNRPKMRNRSLTLIYFSSIDDASDSSISKALKLLWNFQVLNAGIIVSSTKNTRIAISMVTYFPYTQNKCEIIEPVVLNRFDRSNRTWTSRHFFPDKIRNLHGCPIKCTAVEDMPYFELQRNKAGKIVAFRGIEGHLIRFMAGNLNFTPEFFVLSHRKKLAILNETGDTLEELFAGDIKLALGALHSKSGLTTPFSQTNSYLTTNIYLVVNHIIRHKWYKILVRPLQLQVWFFIGLSFVCGCVIIFCVGCFFKARLNAFVIGDAKNAAPYYNMFVIFLGGVYSQPFPRRNFARYLIVLWLLFTFVLRGAYQSGLYEILRDQLDEEPPQTLAEVAKRNYVVKMIPENVRLLKSIPEVKHIEFLQTNELQSFPALANETTHRIGILTPYEYFGYFRKINLTMSKRLTLVRERILASPLSFYLPTNSFLLALLDEQIVSCHNYGFVAKFQSEYLVERREEELGNVRSASVWHRSRGLIFDESIASLHDLGAIFMLHAYLLLITCVVFAVEFATAYYKSIKANVTKRLRI